MGWIHAGTGGGPTPAWVSCQGARFRRVEWREWEGVDTGAVPTRNQAVASAVVALAADPRCAHDWCDGDPGTRDAAAILGHSPQVALRHYRRPRGEDLEAAIRAAGLGTLPGGEVIDLASRRH